MQPHNVSFPVSRLRRLRQNAQIRSLISENTLQISDLIWPLFVCKGTNIKEKISTITLTSIVFAISGVFLMVGNSLSPGELSGNLAAFTMPITFAVLIMIVRKFPTVDMVPAQFVAGISSCLIGFLLSNKLMISSHDIFLGFLAGFFQVGFGFIFITIGARSTPSAMVGVIMLSESVLGPIWAFLFVSERPSMFGLIGGSIILFAVLLQFYSLLSSKKKVSN